MPIGGLYGTYHLLREPGNSIESISTLEDWDMVQGHLEPAIDGRFKSSSFLGASPRRIPRGRGPSHYTPEN